MFRRDPHVVPETLFNSARSYVKSGCSLVRTFCTPDSVAT